MRFRWTALAFVLVLAGLAPRVGLSQGPPQTQKPKPKPVGGLQQNFPNPMNPSTDIPFTVGDYPDCSEPGRKYVVTLTIFDAIAREIAKPVLKGDGRTLNRLQLTCGLYTAHWNGFLMGTSRKAASGIYPYILDVDGHKFPRKMTVAK